MESCQIVSNPSIDAGQPQSLQLNKKLYERSASSVFCLNLSGRNFRLSAVLSGCNGPPDTRFSRGTTRLMSWPDGERYSCLPQSHVIFFLLSIVCTPLFSLTGGVLSHLDSSTHRFPRFSPRNLCYLVFAQRDTAFC